MQIKNPLGEKAILTSGFRTKERPHHEGCDYSLSTPEATYGAPLISPFNEEVTVMDAVVSTNPSGAGSFVRLRTSTRDEGRLVYYTASICHCKELLVKIGDKVPVGHIVALCGNTGDVSPKPTKLNPKLGSHLHFVFGRVSQIANGVWSGETLNPAQFMSTDDPKVVANLRQQVSILAKIIELLKSFKR